MRFKFCGDADCPDWVLAEINNLSMLSSVKLKILGQIVVKGIINPPLNVEKADKIFSDSKLDPSIDLKACIACLNYIFTSTARFNCDHNALHSELQQLGLPKEHSTAIKRVIDENTNEIISKLKSCSLKVNLLDHVSATVNKGNNCINLDLSINGSEKKLLLTPNCLNILLEDLKSVRNSMVELNNAPYMLH